MTSLEFLFLDGGATVTAVLTAGAAAVGIRRHTADPVATIGAASELQQFREALREAQTKVDAAHRLCTEVWRSPLSLFAAKNAKEAAARGIPSWAVASIYKAQRLAGEAMELCDRTDVYEAQMAVAEREGKAVLWEPVRKLTERLGGLAQQLEVHEPFLRAARAAFDAPESAARDDPEAEYPAAEAMEMAASASSGSNDCGEAAAGVKRSSHSRDLEAVLPVVILQEEKTLMRETREGVITTAGALNSVVDKVQLAGRSYVKKAQLALQPSFHS